MTQMLLFDSITSNSLGADAAVAPVVAVVPALSSNSASTTESIRGSANRSANEAATPEPHVRGLNHMGDLARLVLLRHDMVAAQRKQRQSGRRAK